MKVERVKAPIPLIFTTVNIGLTASRYRNERIKRMINEYAWLLWLVPPKIIIIKTMSRATEGSLTYHYKRDTCTGASLNRLEKRRES